MAAEALCPVMWDWVKDIGASFNAASCALAVIFFQVFCTIGMSFSSSCFCAKS